VFEAAVASPTSGASNHSRCAPWARSSGSRRCSLHYYVAKKKALLDGMVDLVYAEIELPSDEADSLERLRATA
jgi:hypothetical protein